MPTTGNNSENSIKPKDTKPKDTKPKDTKPKDTKPKDLAKQPKDTKSIEERLKESMTLLRKLQELGIPSSDPSYKEMSAKMNEWIKGGPVYQGTIDFKAWNRRAKLLLPTIPGSVAKCDFLHHVF